MKIKGLKGVLAGRSWMKIISLMFLFLAVICGFLFVNGLWGNPIRKHKAKSLCLDYFQEKYHQEFIVFDSVFSNLLPGYILALSPKSDLQIKFDCNPNCKIICTSDKYGGVLASLLLVEQINEILEPGYAHLDLQISATEDPYTLFGGETPDYFERDALNRLTKNHQCLSIAWIDPSVGRGEFDQISGDFAGLIDSQLPFINPNLQLTISIYFDESSQLARFEANFVLFPTFELDL